MYKRCFAYSEIKSQNKPLKYEFEIGIFLK